MIGKGDDFDGIRGRKWWSIETVPTVDKNN
jgi:hypothetical protein